jgi:3-oxo-5alpha-steroid 4-dehydrogenase
MPTEGSDTTAPLHVGPIDPVDAREVRFDDETDVVVIGLGIAGCCAALAAADAGAEVVAIERTATPGGTSANSGGLIYLGGGTAVQRACGFDDTAENMARFLHAALGPGGDSDRIDRYCADSVAHFDWLVAHGVPFRAEFCDEPNRESGDDAGLLFSGGEDTWPFDEIAAPVPRGHKPRWVDRAGGFLMRSLSSAVAATSVRVRNESRADRLVMSDGAVIGAQCSVDGITTTLRARHGVVIAAGGFISNDAMVAAHCPLAHRPNEAWRVGTPSDDGRGIRLGMGAGGATRRMDAFECALPLGPPHRLARAILVNAQGERFINEDTYTGRIGLAALAHHDGAVHMITDDVVHERNLVGLRVQWAAGTAEELAGDLGLPVERFARTVREYNEHAARGEDPVFHKRPPFLRPLGVPPASGLGAVDLRVDHGAIYATFTLGGLATDCDGCVLDCAGMAIPGLYAAGRSAASLAAGNYVSGISLGDGSYFGRRAGIHAALRIP